MIDNKLVAFVMDDRAIMIWNAAVNACIKAIDDRKYEYTDLVGMTELVNRLERLKE